MKKFIYPILFVLVFACFFSFQTIRGKPLPFSHRIDFDSFLVRQPDDVTGVSSAVMLLDYYSKSVPLDKVEKEALIERFVGGVSMIAPDSLRVVLGRFGLQSIVLRGNVGDLKRFISEGRPVIVLIRSGDFSWSYCIVYGYDEENVYLGDSDGLPKTVSVIDFENCWSFTHDRFGRKCIDVKGPSESFTMIVPNWQ